MNCRSEAVGAVYDRALLSSKIVDAGCYEKLCAVIDRAYSKTRNPTKGPFSPPRTLRPSKNRDTPKFVLSYLNPVNEYFIGRYGPIAHAVIWRSAPNTGEHRPAAGVLGPGIHGRWQGYRQIRHP